MTDEPNPTDESNHTSESSHAGEPNPTDDLDAPEGVLSPTDLDLDDAVEELDPGRYVVPTDDADDRPTGTHTRGSDRGVSTPSGDDNGDAEAPASSAAYAATVTMRTPDGTDATQIETNDVRELFDELLVWHVERLAPDADPEEALKLLVRSSSLVQSTRGRR